jgi:hypothetical protein
MQVLRQKDVGFATKCENLFAYIQYFSMCLQALKYLLQGRLTKFPVTLSLGRTYVR